MTLNDFKSVAGDKRMGIDSLPVLLGVERAARVACLLMAVPQVVVVGLLIAWGRPLQAASWRLLVVNGADGPLLRKPHEQAPCYNATGTTFYVLGMLTAACAVHLGVPARP